VLSAINEEFSFAYGPPDTVPRYTLYPTTADVLATHVNAAECAMSCTPVPDNAMVVGELLALLTTLTAPVTSLYLNSKPSWWKSSIPWPPNGPDVTGGIGPGGHTNTIPSEACFYNVMGGVEGGAGSPLTFNPSSCYTQTAVQPQPPTGLAATVK